MRIATLRNHTDAHTAPSVTAPAAPDPLLTPAPSPPRAQARLDVQLVAEESLAEQARVSAAACSVLSAAASKIRLQAEAAGGAAGGETHLPELERLELLARVEAERQRAEAFRVRARSAALSSPPLGGCWVEN